MDKQQVVPPPNPEAMRRVQEALNKAVSQGIPLHLQPHLKKIDFLDRELQRMHESVRTNSALVPNLVEARFHFTEAMEEFTEAMNNEKSE